MFCGSKNKKQEEQKKKNPKKEKKNLVMIALCVAIGIMGIAYAAFSTTINVEGTVEAVGDFAVAFQETGASCVGTPAGTATPTPVAVPTIDGRTIRFAANTESATNFALYTPGDTITCTFPVKNTGDLAAKYTSYSVTDGLNETSTPIAIAISEEGTDTLVREETLQAGDTQNVIVVFTYNWAEEEQPEITSKAFEINFNFVQDVK